MTIEEFRRAVKVADFKPFTISLADGRQFFVPHPDFVWIPPEASRVFNVAGKGQDEQSIVDVLMVTSIDCGNGKSRSPKKRRKGK